MYRVVHAIASMPEWQNSSFTNIDSLLMKHRTIPKIYPISSRTFVLSYAVLVWKCLHDAAPPYLADLCVPAHSVHGRQQLRSTASGTLLVPHTRTATGQHSFAVNGPRTSNSLPADLRTLDTTLCSFKRHLKAHLFQQ